MSNIDPKYIKNISGKDFILYVGLVAEAHRIGIQSIVTELVKLDKSEHGIIVVFKATVTGKDSQVFTGYGDATEKNVSKMILPHMIRMAETRAKARALRDFTNIDLCSAEELAE